AIGTPSVPSAALAKSRNHWCAVGLYQRSARKSMGPTGGSIRISARLARPPHTRLTVVVPSVSTHLVDPVSGLSRRLEWDLNDPISKSKGDDTGTGTASLAAIRVLCPRKENFQVLPPSSEYCSAYSWTSSLSFVQTPRTRIARSLKVSDEKTWPCPS